MYYLAGSQPPAEAATALAQAAAGDEESFIAALEKITAPAYRTDRHGTVTHFNSACEPFAGRRPEVRRDRWCVTWKLSTEDGAFLPHEQCPMAVALRENREVRGVRAVAERPDGHRVPFIPYPTPVRDALGNLIGAVNLLLDLSDPRHQLFCREQAARCRRLAAGLGHAVTAASLLSLAAEYESRLVPH